MSSDSTKQQMKEEQQQRTVFPTFNGFPDTEFGPDKSGRMKRLSEQELRELQLSRDKQNIRNLGNSRGVVEEKITKADKAYDRHIAEQKIRLEGSDKKIAIIEKELDYGWNIFKRIRNEWITDVGDANRELLAATTKIRDSHKAQIEKSVEVKKQLTHSDETISKLKTELADQGADIKAATTTARKLAYVQRQRLDAVKTAHKESRDSHSIALNDAKVHVQKHDDLMNKVPEQLEKFNGYCKMARTVIILAGVGIATGGLAFGGMAIGAGVGTLGSVLAGWGLSGTALTVATGVSAVGIGTGVGAFLSGSMEAASQFLKVKNENKSVSQAINDGLKQVGRDTKLSLITAISVIPGQFVTGVVTSGLTKAGMLAKGVGLARATRVFAGASGGATTGGTNSALSQTWESCLTKPAERRRVVNAMVEREVARFNAKYLKEDPNAQLITKEERADIRSQITKQIEAVREPAREYSAKRKEFDSEYSSLKKSASQYDVALVLEDKKENITFQQRLERINRIQDPKFLKEHGSELAQLNQKAVFLDKREKQLAPVQEAVKYIETYDQHIPMKQRIGYLLTDAAAASVGAGFGGSQSFSIARLNAQRAVLKEGLFRQALNTGQKAYTYGAHTVGDLASSTGVDIVALKLQGRPMNADMLMMNMQMSVLGQITGDIAGRRAAIAQAHKQGTAATISKNGEVLYDRGFGRNQADVLGLTTDPRRTTGGSTNGQSTERPTIKDLSQDSSKITDEVVQPIPGHRNEPATALNTAKAKVKEKANQVLGREESTFDDSLDYRTHRGRVFGDTGVRPIVDMAAGIGNFVTKPFEGWILKNQSRDDVKRVRKGFQETIKERESTITSLEQKIQKERDAIEHLKKHDARDSYVEKAEERAATRIAKYQQDIEGQQQLLRIDNHRINQLNKAKAKNYGFFAIAHNIGRIPYKAIQGGHWTVKKTGELVFGFGKDQSSSPPPRKKEKSEAKESIYDILKSPTVSLTRKGLFLRRTSRELRAIDEVLVLLDRDRSTNGPGRILRNEEGSLSRLPKNKDVEFSKESDAQFLERHASSADSLLRRLIGGNGNGRPLDIALGQDADKRLVVDLSRMQGEGNEQALRILAQRIRKEPFLLRKRLSQIRKESNQLAKEQIEVHKEIEELAKSSAPVPDRLRESVVQRRLALDLDTEKAKSDVLAYNSDLVQIRPGNENRLVIARIDKSVPADQQAKIIADVRKYNDDILPGLKVRDSELSAQEDSLRLIDEKFVRRNALFEKREQLQESMDGLEMQAFMVNRRLSALNQVINAPHAKSVQDVGQRALAYMKRLAAEHNQLQLAAQRIEANKGNQHVQELCLRRNELQMAKMLAEKPDKMRRLSLAVADEADISRLNKEKTGFDNLSATGGLAFWRKWGPTRRLDNALSWPINKLPQFLQPVASGGVAYIGYVLSNPGGIGFITKSLPFLDPSGVSAVGAGLLGYGLFRLSFGIPGKMKVNTVQMHSGNYRNAVDNLTELGARTLDQTTSSKNQIMVMRGPTESQKSTIGQAIDGVAYFMGLSTKPTERFQMVTKRTMKTRVITEVDDAGKTVIDTIEPARLPKRDASKAETDEPDVDPKEPLNLAGEGTRTRNLQERALRIIELDQKLSKDMPEGLSAEKQRDWLIERRDDLQEIAKLKNQQDGSRRADRTIEEKLAAQGLMLDAMKKAGAFSPSDPAAGKSSEPFWKVKFPQGVRRWFRRDSSLKDQSKTLMEDLGSQYHPKGIASLRKEMSKGWEPGERSANAEPYDIVQVGAQDNGRFARTRSELLQSDVPKRSPSKRETDPYSGRTYKTYSHEDVFLTGKTEAYGYDAATGKALFSPISDGVSPSRWAFDVGVDAASKGKVLMVDLRQELTPENLAFAQNAMAGYAKMIREMRVTTRESPTPYRLIVLKGDGDIPDGLVPKEFGEGTATDIKVSDSMAKQNEGDHEWCVYQMYPEGQRTKVATKRLNTLRVPPR